MVYLGHSDNIVGCIVSITHKKLDTPNHLPSTEDHVMK